MSKVLVLLLVTLVHSQSDGVLLPNSNTIDDIQDSQMEEWASSEFSYPAEANKDFEVNLQPYKKRSVTSDAFTRRSALDKNFMRFGRGCDTLQQSCGRVHSDGKLSFYRFGRGPKDSFIRFGRARDNFIRFGRGGPEDFFRAGKSLRENFIRFGKADKNFLRFGRGEGNDKDYEEFFYLEEPFQGNEKSSKMQDRFMRMGKNGTNFLRFGKSNADTETDVRDRNQDSETTKEELKRKKRGARAKLSPKGPKGKSKRWAEFFEASPVNFPRRLSPAIDSPWQNLENLRNSRLTPFFPVFSSFPKSFKFNGAETKRSQGERNFIRFG